MMINSPFERRVDPTPDVFADQVNNIGLKWSRVTIDQMEWDPVEATGTYSKQNIDPSWQQAITGLANRGIKMIYSLAFWDEQIQSQECYHRFKQEEEIQRYLDYVKFIVQNFKDRIQYYEMINEPRFSECAPFNQQNIEPADYIELVRRTVEVIRQESPEAKIVVGATVLFYERYYLFEILESDIMPLVDGVSWHPMFGTSPEHQSEYYYNYSSIVQEIKDMAVTHDFEGEFIAEELSWGAPGYSDTAAAKYFARGIMMHLGMDVFAGMNLNEGDDLKIPRMKAIRNLSTIMAGAEPVSLPVEIQSEATKMRSYSFSLSNGDNLIALWTDGVAVDEDPGVKANLTFQGFTAQDVTGFDVLVGFQQPIIASNENGNLVISNLLVRDYPLILRLSPVAKPAVFTDLTVSPTEAQLGQPVEISVKVTNVGGMESSYTVILTINGIVEDSETITLVGGESTTVTFKPVKEDAGMYDIDVSGLKGAFSVKEIPPPPPPTEPFPMWIVGIAIAAIGIALAALLVV
ncbi:MAG: family 1 glycosylhydrolase, partial [Bacteroidota bacterium]